MLRGVLDLKACVRDPPERQPQPVSVGAWSYYDIASNVQTTFVDDSTLPQRAKFAGEKESRYYEEQVLEHNKTEEERVKKKLGHADGS